MNKELRNNQRAFEWHNPCDGHCYVDYIEDASIDNKDEYDKIPLFAMSDITELWAVYEKGVESVISVHQTFEGAIKNRDKLNRIGGDDYCYIDLVRIHA